MSSESTSPTVAGRGGTAATRRRLREAEIISATRRLFDERGVRDAQIEDIARAVGINRAIIYRHFTGKEELFSLTLVQYLDELRVALEEAARTTDEPRAQLERLVEAFVDYGLAHPAFVDCAQAIMRRPGGDLLEEVYASGLGTLQLGRVAMLVSEEAPGVPRISRVTAEQVRDHMVATALAVAAGGPHGR